MANKKINQLVLKTTIQSTDLFPLGDPTTGQLFKKTIAELQAAIGGAVISVNGLVGTVVLDTDDIQELATPTNRYFTEARARASISLTTTGNSGASTYSSSTGVLNVPTYTLAGLGGITAGFLSGGTGITYNSSTGVISYSGTVYTDSSIRALLSGANGISYNSSTGQFTYSGTVYTDSSIRALLSGTAPITYNSSTGAIGITQATTSTDGYLSSTDWNTFNGKQSALTLGNLTEATSSVLTITGGTGAVIGSGTSIQVKQASSTVSGFLSSTDWNTFNGKQNVITNPVTGTGTSGYHAKWTSSSVIANSNLYDSGSNVGLGTTSPTGASGTTFEINGGSGQGRLAIKNIATGSTSTDGLQFGVDTGGGAFIEQRGANTLQFATNGNGRLFITSAGYVGINTTSPGVYLDVQGGTTSAFTAAIMANSTLAFGSTNGRRLVVLTSTQGDKNGLQLGYDSTDGTGIIAAATESAGAGLDFYTYNGTTWASRMRVLKDGRVAIGRTNPEPGVKLLIAHSGGIGIEFSPNDNVANKNRLLSYDRVNFVHVPMVYQASVHEFAQGNILMGTSTDNGERLYVSGSIRATGSITANSDARLKKNIERIENALEKVGQISGYTYNTIYDEDRHAGVIAQEIDKVLPEIVNKGNDGLMGVEYGNISALLIEAIKDLKQRNEKLEAIVEGLSK